MAELAVRLTEIAQFVNGELIGDPDLVVRGFAPLASAGPFDLSFLDNEKYVEEFRRTKAGAVVTGLSVEPRGKRVIRVQDPYLAFARLLRAYTPAQPCPFEGVSPQAFVHPDAALAEGVRLAPGVYVGPGARVGRGTELWPGVSVGPGATIGEDCRFYPNVVVYHDCAIGDRVIVHGGSVIGADGFGFAPDGDRYEKIPQIGTVVIEDDVEIGANTTIDRATLGMTRIGRGTKIDNLVMVAHNCEIGEDSILVAQVGVSGSTALGKHVVLAGQVGVCGHLRIGDFARIGAQSGVTKSLPGGQEFLGAPAIPVAQFKRLQAHLRKLPELREKVKELEAKLAELLETTKQA